MPSLTARARWGPIVRDLEASGQTTAAFAQTRGLNPHTLAWWRWRLRRDATEASSQRAGFAELTVVGAGSSTPVKTPPAHRSGLVVCLDGYGAHLHVDSHTDLTLLREVLEALC